LFVLTAAAVAATCIAPAFSQGGLPSLAKQVADGRPWTMTMAEGRTGKLILKPDGTGRMEGGPIPMSPTWRETADGICVKPSIVMPERCAALRREGGRIVASRDGAVQFRLERP
jgi:hypothetical protein